MHLIDQPQPDSRPAQILSLIARHREMTIAEMVAALGVTTTAVRQHVNRLVWEGWLIRHQRRSGAGRPADVFTLSEQSRRAFAHEVHEFTRALLDEVAESEGSEKLQFYLSRVSRRMSKALEAQAGDGDPAERIERVVNLLRERGTVAETQVGQEGVHLSVHTCPFHGLGAARREICEMERETLGRLGGGAATLKQSLAEGAPCCEFEVGLAPPQSNGNKKASDA